MKKPRSANSHGWVVESTGWVGVLLVLIGYVLITLKLLTADSLLYQLFNIIGSIFLAIESLSKKDNQLTILNFIWAFIALVALARAFL